MRDQQKFRLTFHATCAVVIFMYLVLGVCGAMALGSKLPEIVLFYFNKHNVVFYYLGFAYALVPCC